MSEKAEKAEKAAEKALVKAVEKADKEEKTEEKNFEKPEYYTNRELSWLSFNFRILSEARNKSLPSLERLKFLSITASNLDEFFMIRVASLKDMVHAKYTKKDVSGMTPAEQLEAISKEAHKMVDQQYSTYNRALLPLIKSQGLEMVTEHEKMTKKQAEYADAYFEENVYPVITPMAVDSSRPFPLLRNKALYIGALISKKGEKKAEADFATVQVPSVLPRVVHLPDNPDGSKCIILLEELIERNMYRLFSNYDVICAHPYRVMRNADLTLDEDEAEDLLKEIEKQLKKRQWGEVIRLEVEDTMDPMLLKILKKELKVKDDDIYKINGPLDLTFLMQVYKMDGMDEYRQKPYTPQPVPGMNDEEDIFTQIRKGDILLHHPYMTFEPVIDLVKQAAVDPDVLAIKQTLYRVSGNSPIVAALAQAADNGKQVTVLVELKARFDEENNINWAKMLEQAGCHVIYGLVGLKTHCKITLVVRREDDGIRRYVHLSTGNYNDSTAKQYTDCGLLTCSDSIGEDATAVFNMLSGYSEPKHWNSLALAPYWLRDRFLYLIRRERDHARNGHPARIIAKMNSLCDKEIIAALYEASAAGVEIDLIIRGICSLKVGIPGVSETIHVRSIVGTFLEHARIFYFLNDEDEEFYMASADWMPRNLDKRVEILFPIEDTKLKEQLRHILQVQLDDTLKARVLQPDGSYKKVDKRGKEPLCAQDYFCQEAMDMAKEEQEREKEENPGLGRRFVPAEPAEE